MNQNSDILLRLQGVIAARLAENSEPGNSGTNNSGLHVGSSSSAPKAPASYVAKLNAGGVPKIAQKLGEEAVETVVAALCETREELIGESADLLFHLLVLLGAKGVAIEEVLDELERREGVSGIAEKAARGSRR